MPHTLCQHSCRLIPALLTLAVVLGVPAAADAEPVRVGELQAIRWTPELELAERSEKGRRLRHEITVPGAAFLKPRFVGLDLVAGEVLIVRRGDGFPVERLTGDGPLGGRAFWGLAVPGERLGLELELRPGPAHRRPPVRIDGILVGDPEALARATGGHLPKSLCAPADFEDAACYLADANKWANILATAGVLTAESGGAFWCTGISVSPRNLVLTAASCLADTAACEDAEFVFGYYRDGCGDLSPIAAGWQSYRCLETVASSPFGACEPAPESLDFSLHQVEGDPAGDWGWADPDATALNSGESLYIVQHADARPLEITHGDGADVEVDGMTLRYYGTLDTESSSVGAPIFREADDRLVGMHHCGGCASPGVGNRGVLMPDVRPLVEDFLCQPSLALETVTVISVQPLTGNGDAVLDPGETWRFTPVLRNAACAAATTGVSASFAVGAGSAAVQLLDTSSDFGDMSAASTATGSPVRFVVDETAPCQGAALIDLVTITSDGGGFAGASPYLQLELGEVPETQLLAEEFEGGLPGTWTVVDGGTTAGGDATWTATNPGARVLLDPPFMIADSEFQGPGEVMDEELITPPLDTTAPDHLTLRFRHDFRWFDQGLDEQGDVEVRSAATGGAWTPVANFQDTDASGPVALDLTPYRAADLQVRFRYSQAEWEWWWAIDDVEIVGDDGRACFTGIFADGFESGSTGAWSSATP